MAIPSHLRSHPIFSGSAFGLMSGESPRFPASQKPTHENLVNVLRNQGIAFEETHGRYDDPERSVIIHSPTREMMHHLGKHFGQESVVYSNGGKHELLYTNGEHEGKSRLTKPGSEAISWFHEAPENYYTHLPNHGYFGINFDFDQDPQHHGPTQAAPAAAPMAKADKHRMEPAFKHRMTGNVYSTGSIHNYDDLQDQVDTGEDWMDPDHWIEGFVDNAHPARPFYDRKQAAALVMPTARHRAAASKYGIDTKELESQDYQHAPVGIFAQLRSKKLSKAHTNYPDFVQVLQDELGMQGWKPTEIPQSAGIRAVNTDRSKLAGHKDPDWSEAIAQRTDSHYNALAADIQERGHTFDPPELGRVAEQQVGYDLGLAHTSRDPADSNYNPNHFASLPGVLEADNFGKDLTGKDAAPEEVATSTAANIPTAAKMRAIWHSHPHAYDWHDGHSDHHQQAPNLEAIQKSFGLYKADGAHPHMDTPPKNDQAAGVGVSTYAKFAGPYGEVKGSATPSDLTHYNYHGKLPEIEALVKQHGFKTYFAGGKYGKPDLQARNYNNGHLMVTDPTPQSGGDFRAQQYTNAWRQIHELSHALTHPEVNSIYGEARRVGKLGTHRTPNEVMRAVHWEWLAAHKQRELSQKLGVHVPDEVFHKELNTVMHDAVHRAVTGQFADAAAEGFAPHAHKVPLHIALDTVRDAAQSMGIQHPHGLMKKSMLKAWPKGATETQDSPENQANAAAHKAITERAEVFGDKQEEQGLPRTGVHPNSLTNLRSRAQIGLNRPAEDVWRTAEARHANDIARFNDSDHEHDQPSTPPMPAAAYIEGGGYDQIPHGTKDALFAQTRAEADKRNDQNYWAAVGRAAGIQKSDPLAPNPQLHSSAESFMAALKGIPKGSSERGKFITQHMSHAPFISALQAHPQGKQIHQMLMGFLNSTANAGPKAPMKVVAKNEIILSKQGNTMSEKTYTPQEAVEILKKAAADKIKAMESKLQDLRKREQLSKGLVPPHKHNVGSPASAGMEDVPPSKLNPPGKADKLVGGTATQKGEESSAHEETSGEISADDMAKALLCKKCGKSHDLEKGCDGMGKAELVDAKGNTESNSEVSAATMPDDESKHVNKPTKSKPGSGGVITKGKKLGKSLGEIRSLAKTAGGPPTAKPPSGTNMATKVPTSAPKAPVVKAVDKIVVPKSQKPKVPSAERDHTVQVSKDKTVYEKKPELEKGVMADIARKNNAGAPTPKDPGANVKLPSPAQQTGRANMFGAAMAGEYQPPATTPAKMAPAPAPAKPVGGLASPKAAGITPKPAMSAGPVMNAARPSKPGIFGRLLGKK